MIVLEFSVFLGGKKWVHLLIYSAVNQKIAERSTSETTLIYYKYTCLSQFTGFKIQFLQSKFNNLLYVEFCIES